MKYSIKALNPVYKAYVNRITNKVSGIPGVLSVNLDSEGQYDFTFTFEKDKESNLSQITEQIRYPCSGCIALQYWRLIRNKGNCG